MAIMPGASRVQKFSGNRHKRTITKIVLHTTEGSSWPGYGGGGSAPHFTVHRDGTIRQHIDTAYSAKALVNRSGGVETNNGGAIQIEYIGSCDRSYARKHGLFFTEEADDDDLAGLARVLAWINREHGVPLTANGLRWPTSNAAYATAPQRFSYAEWNAYRGVCGHTHVPENDHWDPGAFPIDRLLRLAGDSLSIPVGGGAGVPRPSAPDPARPWRSSPRVAGMSAGQVRRAQDLVGVTVDGKYGDQTGAAVRSLQQQLDLTADGVWGPTTERHVMSLITDIWAAEITLDNGKRVTMANAIRETHAVAAENQRRINHVEAIVTENQVRITDTRDQTSGIYRGGKLVTLRQEVADTKTLQIAATGTLEKVIDLLEAADVDTTIPHTDGDEG